MLLVIVITAVIGAIGAVVIAESNRKPEEVPVPVEHEDE
jgi:hypothetical protein